MIDISNPRMEDFARASGLRAVEPLLPPVAAKELIDEIFGHLGAAVRHAIPTDDSLNAAHVKAAYELTRVLWRASQ